MAENEQTPAAPGDDEAGTLRTRFEEQSAADKRTIALLRAGIDIDSPLGTMFAKAYDGELNPDAIKEGWAAVAPASVVDPAVPPVGIVAPVSAAEQTALRGAGQLADDAAIVNPDADVDPTTAAIGDFYDGLKKGLTRDQAAPLAFDRIFGAAAKGDPRVLVLNGRQGEGAGPGFEGI